MDFYWSQSISFLSYEKSKLDLKLIVCPNSCVVGTLLGLKILWDELEDDWASVVMANVPVLSWPLEQVRKFWVSLHELKQKFESVLVPSEIFVKFQG